MIFFSQPNALTPSGSRMEGWLGRGKDGQTA